MILELVVSFGIGLCWFLCEVIGDNLTNIVQSCKESEAIKRLKLVQRYLPLPLADIVVQYVEE